jgi:hypothetical protein
MDGLMEQIIEQDPVFRSLEGGLIKGVFRKILKIWIGYNNLNVYRQK